MELKKELTLVLWIVALFGIFLLGRGITGNAIMNSYTTNDYCIEDRDCSNGKICCYYESGKGMCSEAKMCEELFSKENPEIRKDYSSDMIIGLLIIASVLIAFYVNSKEKRKISKRRLKRKNGK